MTRTRIRTKNPDVQGGGGGGTTVGNFRVGPDYGEGAGNDGVTFASETGLDLPSINLSGDTLGEAVLAGAMGLDYSSSSPAVESAVDGTALGAPFFQSVETNGATGGINSQAVSINVPSGVVDGDLLVAFIGTRLTTGPSITLPAGWTSVNSRVQAGQMLECAYRYASSEPTSYSFTGSGTGTATTNGGIYHIIGTHASSPVDVSAVSGGSLADPAAPSVTTTVVNTKVIAAISQTPPLSTSYTPAAGFVERWDFSTGVAATLLQACVQDRIFSAAGSTGSIVFNSPQAINPAYAAITVAIAPGTVDLVP